MVRLISRKLEKKAVVGAAGELTSYKLPSVVLTKETGRVVYRPGEWTLPAEGCGPLTVFRMEVFARKYVSSPSRRDGKVYRCLYEPSALSRVWFRHCGYAITREIASMPRGVILARRVQLLEEVSA